MQLKRSLIGAVVGGALGAAVLVAAYFLFGIEHTSLAILVALLVGVGVRTVVATRGHASYLRGAVTALLAIAAFLGGKFLVAEIAARQVAHATRPPMIAPAPTERIADESDESDDTQDPPAESADSMELEDEQAPTRDMPQQQLNMADQQLGAPAADVVRFATKRGYDFSMWDFIWLVAAALVAYELGRGSGMAAPRDSTNSGQPATA